MFCVDRGGAVQKFKPGQSVLQSGVYRARHDSHRLMHQASLRAGETFPRCKQCGTRISFELVRKLPDAEVLPFSEGSLFQKHTELPKTQLA